MLNFMKNIGIPGIAVVLAISLGASCERWKNERLKYEYDMELANENLKLNQKVFEQSANFSIEATKLDTESTNTINGINQYYSTLLASVYNDSESTDNPEPVPDNSSIASGNAGTPCKCSEQDGGNFQELQKKTYELAKDCDITTARYNQLLKLYRTIQTSQEIQ